MTKTLPNGDKWGPLPDMSGVRLTDIAEPGLVRSAARYVRQLDDPNGVISAFSSFVKE